MTREEGFSPIRFILTVCLLIIIFGGIGGILWYTTSLNPVQKNSERYSRNSRI